MCFAKKNLPKRNEKKRSKIIETICMNEMSCRFRQNSCAKWKGKKASMLCKVCNFRGEAKKE